MTKGIVKWFDMSKGFGFIQGTDGQDVFVHFDQVMTVGYEPLLEGQEVTFIVRQEAKGFRALDVRVVANSQVKSKSLKSNGNKAQPAETKVKKPKAKKPKPHKRPVSLMQTRSEAVGHRRAKLWSG